MSIPILTLSKFQHNSLLECANSPVNTYMLVRPNANDAAEQQQLWGENNIETDELVRMGLLDDASEEFAAQIEAHFKMSGRVFRVFRITAQGKAMFNEPSTSASLN